MPEKLLPHCCGLLSVGLLNLQSMLLTDATEKLDPMSLLFYMSSFSVLLLLPATVVLEPGAFAQVGWGRCWTVCRNCNTWRWRQQQECCGLCCCGRHWMHCLWGARCTDCSWVRPDVVTGQATQAQQVV